MEFKKENKYLVLKWNDIGKLLEPHRGNLEDIIRKIEYIRLLDGKKENSYVVVNEDEPYAKAVWKLIEEGETKKECQWQFNTA